MICVLFLYGFLLFSSISSIKTFVGTVCSHVVLDSTGLEYLEKGRNAASTCSLYACLMLYCPDKFRFFRYLLHRNVRKYRLFARRL